MQTQTTTELNDRLSAIQKDGREADKLLERGHRALWDSVAKIAFWYHDARNERGYLTSLLKQASIDFRSAPDTQGFFSALMRLVFGLDPDRQASTISERGQSVYGLWLKIMAEPEKYATDGVAQLANEIIEAGGLGPFRDKEFLRKMEQAAGLVPASGDTGEDAAQNTDAEQSAKPDETEQLEAVRNALRTAILQQEPKVTLPAFPQAIPNDDGLFICVMKHVPTTNQLEVLSFTNDRELVDDVVDVPSRMIT